MTIAEYRINDLERAVQSLRYDIENLQEENLRLKGRISDLESRRGRY